MLGSGESVGRELQYTYIILRRLKNLRIGSERRHPGITWDLPINVTDFGLRFALKLLDDKLAYMDQLASKLISILTRKLIEASRNNIDEGNVHAPDRDLLLVDIDEYFHLCLFHLYDFWCELGWREGDLNDLLNIESSSKILSSKWPYARKFLHFRTTLYIGKARLKAEQKQGLIPAIKTSGKVSSPSLESLKSSLATSSQQLSSIEGLKKRVRFEGPSSHDTQDKKRNTSDDHTVFAHLLIMFGLDLFITKLVESISSLTERETHILDLTVKLRNTKRKLRSNELSLLQRLIKQTTEIYLLGLDQLDVIKQKYVVDRLTHVIGARDSSRILRYQKRPLTHSFISTFLNTTEVRLVQQLSNSYVQVILDLILNEINLPPTELSVETGSRSLVETRRIQENQTNFITSWFNFDWLYNGRSTPQPDNENSSATITKIANKESTLSMHKFKSSSRILAQMDNLSELSRTLMQNIVERLRSTYLVEDFLNITLSDVSHCFDRISIQLLSQLVTLRLNQPEDSELARMSSSRLNEKLLASNIDLLAAKVRCIKCGHIFSSLETSLKIMANRYGSDLRGITTLERRISEFSEKCSNK